MAASRNPRARLLHIRDEIAGVAATVRGLSFVEYRNSYMHRRAVERAVQIISEAAKALPKDVLALHGDAPWASIVGIGNILRHEYQRLDDKQLWEIATVPSAKAGAGRTSDDYRGRWLIDESRIFSTETRWRWRAGYAMEAVLKRSCPCKISGACRPRKSLS